MREDMARVIVERPRYTPKAGKGRRQSLDDWPMHEGMRRPHVLRGDDKSFSDYLAPLRRYLAAQVGRPWRKVYADITVHLSSRSTVQQHLRDHLHDFVAISPRLISRAWLSGGRGELWSQEFYVDPRTDLLCRTDQHPVAKARRRAAARAGSIAGVSEII